MIHQKLEQQIEELVREHLESLRKTAAAALERGFAATYKSAPAGGRAVARPRVRRSQRSAEELARLQDDVCAAVCAMPGATIGELAARLGTTQRRLEVPIRRARENGRMRSVGRRGFMRYYPMAEGRVAEVELAVVGKVA